MATNNLKNREYLKYQDTWQRFLALTTFLTLSSSFWDLHKGNNTSGLDYHILYEDCSCMSKKDDTDFEDLDDLLDDIEDENTPEIAEAVLKTPKQENISLFFRSTIGPRDKIEKLSVNVDMPILELKQTLANIFGLESEDFYLSFSGRIADNEDIVSNYDLEDGMNVLLIPVSVAG